MSNPKLYYTNAGGDYNWETLSNWNTESDGSGDIATNIPWTDDGNGGAWYGDYDLITAGITNGIEIQSTIDPNEVVTGSCDIPNLYLHGVIYGGTFTGDGFYNNGYILGGTFSGDNFYNDNGISGGTFTGYNFYNHSGISGGTFEIGGFENSNNGTVEYQSISITSGGNPYTGVWDGQNWDCTGNWFSPSNEDGQTHTDPNDTMCRNSSVDTLGYCCGDSVPFWRFDNLSNDAKWTTLKNWNFNKNSSTWHPSVPPWTSATTAGTSLYMAPGNSQPPVLNGLILGENTDGTFFLISGRTDPFITNQVLINSLSIINSIIL